MEGTNLAKITDGEGYGSESLSNVSLPLTVWERLLRSSTCYIPEEVPFKTGKKVLPPDSHIGMIVLLK